MSRRTSPGRERPKRNEVPALNGFGLGAARKSTACGGPVTGPDQLVSTSIAAGWPQLPAPSRARTQILRLADDRLAVENGAEACTVAPPNVPDMVTPAPDGAGEFPMEYSAAVTTPPPDSASLNVAHSVVSVSTRMGVGLQLTLPATATGPRVSPPERASVNEPLMAASACSAGAPSSVTRTRTRTLAEFGVGGPEGPPARSQTHPESEYTAAGIGAQVSPPSSE